MPNKNAPRDSRKNLPIAPQSESNISSRKEILDWFLNDPLFNFLLETILSTAGFLVVALIAIGLNLLVHNARQLGIDDRIIAVLEWLEYLLFGVDVIGFVKYLWAKHIHSLTHQNKPKPS
jgi:hypothetical protein